MSATEAASSRKLQITGLLLGIFSVIHPVVMAASAVINIRELRRGTGGDWRWMNVAGLVLSGVWLLVWAVGISFLVMSH